MPFASPLNKVIFASRADTVIVEDDKRLGTRIEVWPRSHWAVYDRALERPREQVREHPTANDFPGYFGRQRALTIN